MCFIFISSLFLIYDCENVVGSAYMLGRSLTSILWGVIADRYGRKPVAILGIISV